MVIKVFGDEVVDIDLTRKKTSYPFANNLVDQEEEVDLCKLLLAQYLDGLTA